MTSVCWENKNGRKALQIRIQCTEEWDGKSIAGEFAPLPRAEGQFVGRRCEERRRCGGNWNCQFRFAAIESGAKLERRADPLFSILPLSLASAAESEHEAVHLRLSIELTDSRDLLNAG